MDVADSEKYHHGLLLLWKRVGWVEVTPKQYRNEQLGRTMGGRRVGHACIILGNDFLLGQILSNFFTILMLLSMYLESVYKIYNTIQSLLM